MKTLVHVFISSRIDYCNSVFFGISGHLLQRLQAIQNAAVRLVTGARRSQHVTLILCQLHCLTTRQRILFKTAELVYKCWRGMVSSYLSTYCVPTWSHDDHTISVTFTLPYLDNSPCTMTNYGRRSFVISGPVVWNSLPSALRLDMSIFRRRLKTFFMTEATDSLYQLTWRICCIFFELAPYKCHW